MVDLLTIWNLYSQYVFGSAALAGIFFLLFIFISGIRFGWSLATYLVVLTPTVFLLSTHYLSVDLQPILLIGVGMLIGIAMLVMIRR